MNFMFSTGIFSEMKRRTCLPAWNLKFEFLVFFLNFGDQLRELAENLGNKINAAMQIL